ncbi:unnamed protein product [Cyclocybe aegerita]|uniref:F-box domain-containing protein n=1 Tax=Cyclocybe aegerita TaxID=1973307 RepID=A0A8S0VU04_CYCAE|nr:unnamed protein product [Cyclocybe aegerita]
MPALLRTHPNTTLTKPRDITACRLQNRLLPALQLCPDLLEYLFLLGASLETEDYHRRRAVLAYSQVCHDWRTTALATKSLWVQLTDFDDMSWRWNEEMLRRSHPLPVEVGSCTFPPRKTNSISSEMGYLGRIRTYWLGFADETWDILEKKLQEPAENFECLSLAYTPLRASKTNRPWYILPRNLFDNRAPQLRRLKLEGCTLDFGTPALRSLTSLTVINLDTTHKLAPSTFDWIALVSMPPFITDFFLRDAIFTATSPSDPHAQFSTIPSSKTRLSRLTSLHLEANISDVAAFLKFIILPAARDLSLTCSDALPGAEMEGILEAFGDVAALSVALAERLDSSPIRMEDQAQMVAFLGALVEVILKPGDGCCPLDLLQNFKFIRRDCTLGLLDSEDLDSTNFCRIDGIDDKPGRRSRAPSQLTDDPPLPILKRCSQSAREVSNGRVQLLLWK